VALVCSNALGQNSGYEPLKSNAPIPRDITISSSEKYASAKKNLENENSDLKEKKTKQNFLLESHFLVDQVLHSGRVLFNDTVSDYLNQVLDEVLKVEPELRSKLRVYAVRSSVVNSFTTDDGIILVNIGLLAQLETEAQLAFVLCHEIAHYTEHHVINTYVQNEELKEGATLKRTNFDDKLLSQSQYSKQLEKEADKLGIDRFLKTDYGTQSVLSVFDVMRYSHLPFDDIPFDKNYFNEGYYKVDESYYLNNVRPVEDWVQNSESTHPSPIERQQLLRTKLATTGKPEGNEFILGKEQFNNLRALSRFELSNLYLKSNSPIKSIYNAFLLQREYPEDRYLKSTVATALYRLSKFKSGGNYGMVHPGYTHIEGESQQLYHLLYRLKPEELCVLATGHVWRLHQAEPNDSDLTLMANDLLDDLMRQYYVPGMFSRAAPAPGWDQPDTTEAKNKYDRLRQKAKTNPRLSMVKYALVDLFENAEFASAFDSLEQVYWGPNSTREMAPDEQKNRSDLRHWKNHGFALGAEKVVVVSPTYSKLDLRKKRKHKFLRSQSAKEKFIGQIDRSAGLLNIDLEILDQSNLDSSDVETFNDITFLNEWIDSRFTDLEVGMANLPSGRINSLIEKYGTEHFAWTGVINYRENKPLMYFYLLYALIPPAIPFAVYYLVRPNYDTYYYCIVFNLRTGEPELVNYANYRKRDARDMINSSVYDSFWQMKRKSKKKG
jgi:hypothetical protein